MKTLKPIAAAALALLFFVIDGVPQGEGYVFARKESQARIVFNRMSAMIASRLRADFFRSTSISV